MTINSIQLKDVVCPQPKAKMMNLSALGTTGVQEAGTIQCVADAGVKEIQTLTFPAFAAITDRDYIIVEDTLGGKWAVYADKTGTSAAPTGALYTAIPAANKIKADISGDTTAAQVAARFELAFDGLTGFTAKIVTDDTAADGTMTFTQTKVGPVTNPVPKDLNDGTAGTLAGVQTTGGVASNLNSKYFNYFTVATNYYVWMNVNSEGVDPAIAGKTGVEIVLAASDSANTIATAVKVALDALAGVVATVSTDTVTATNVTDGSVSDSANGAASPGFTFNTTIQGVTSLVALVNGKNDATIAEASGPGDYTITFNEPFVQIPSVVVMCSSSRAPRIAACSISAVQVQMNLLADGTLSDAISFDLIVLGSMATDLIN